MKHKNSLIISSQAIYQTKFWYKIALKLKKDFKKIIIVCFDNESHSFLKNSKLEHIFISPDYNLKQKKISEILKKNNIKNIEKIILHERIYYGDRNKAKIISKFCSYIDSIEKYLIKIDYKNYFILQELGGFASNMSMYYLSKKLKINNYFIEPAFFTGRFHIIKNTLKCDPVFNKKLSTNNFNKIFKDLQKSKNIIIPKKDFMHFKSPILQILNVRNIIRFFNKLYKIYVLNYKFEFDEITKYSISFFKNLINYFFLLPVYKNDLDKKKFYYFPLHVPNDFAVTVRAPKYIDQIELVNQIQKKLSSKVKLLIKEHPARIGAINFLKIYKLIKSDKVRILNPKLNTYDIIENSEGVITINSKTGFEALIRKKPLFVFGESYYKNQNFIVYVNKYIDLKNNKINPQSKEIKLFFKKLYKKTFRGELYFLKNNNINSFSKSIKSLNAS